MACARLRACVRGRRTCSVSCTSSCSETGEQQSRLVRCRTRLCLPAVASCRRCWWLCCSSSARCPGRVDCRPRGRPQWGASGATDADATRHQVGARPSDLDHSMTRRAGYPGMAVRPDESIFPRSCVVPSFTLHQPQPNPVQYIYRSVARGTHVISRHNSASADTPLMCAAASRAAPKLIIRYVRARASAGRRPAARQSQPGRARTRTATVRRIVLHVLELALLPPDIHQQPLQLEHALLQLELHVGHRRREPGHLQRV